MWKYDDALLNEISRIKAGDFSNYEQFYNMTAGYVYKLICDVISDINVANEVLTDAYNRIYAEIPGLENINDFYGFAGRIATDVTYARVNAMGVISLCTEETRSQVFEVMSQDTEPIISEYVMSSEEVKRLFEEEIDKLPITAKIILQYYFYESLSVSEISARTGIDAVEVKKIIANLKDRLKLFIEGYPFDSSQRFYSLAEMPFFLGVFAYALQKTSGMDILAIGGAAFGAGAIAGAATGGVISTGTAVSGGGVASAGATGAAASGVAGTGGAGVAGAAASGVAGTGAATASAVGIGVGAKIGIGVVAVAVLTGGSIGLHHIITKDKDNTTEVATVTDADSDTTEAYQDTTEIVEETTEEIIESNPVYDIYYFDSEYNSVEDTTYSCSIAYLTYEGSAFPALRDSFNAWQDEKINAYYEYVGEVAGWEMYADSKNSYDVSIYYGRHDDKVLCATWSDYTYSGGAHGYGTASSANFDVQTGNILTLQNLGENVPYELQTAIYNYINADESLKNVVDSNYEEKIAEKIADGSLNWHMERDSIKVVFSQYEIAPYMAGPISMEIPFSELPSLNPYYYSDETIICENLISGSENWKNPSMYDVNFDGAVDEISMLERYSSEESGSYYYLDINGTAVTEEIFFSSLEIYNVTGKYTNPQFHLIANPDKRSFVVMEFPVSGEESNYYVYELTTGSGQLVQSYTANPNMGFYMYYGMITTDVNAFGSYEGTKVYTIGEGGFNTKDLFYEFKKDDSGRGVFEIITKIEVPCKYEKDGTLAEGTIPAQTAIYPMACDPDHCIFEFVLEDGTKGRIYYENGENGISVNGVFENDLFTSLPYAN